MKTNILFNALFVMGVLWVCLLPVTAQETAINPNDRVIVLSTQGNDGLTIGSFNWGDNLLGLDYNPTDINSYARIDGVGMLRFSPIGTPEGVYTFAPYFDGYSAGSALDNKLWVREVQWSPDGRQIAFIIRNTNLNDVAQGVWFWQPAREIATDPSYQLLRHCPPACELASAIPGDAWTSTSVAWSPDSQSVLVGLYLPNENRRAYTVRPAARDINNTQAITRPDILRYSYAHWGLDSNRLIVSGHNPDGQIVFGTIGRDGSNALTTPATQIGMNWVQSAVQQADGRLVMLGSTINEFSPVQLVAEDGQVLTSTIGNSTPNDIDWSPDRTAVRLRISGRTYIALTSGMVYDITETIGNAQVITWVPNALPARAQPLPLPAPISQTETNPTPTPSPAPNSDTAVTGFAVGDLLRIIVPEVRLLDSPIGDADIVTVLSSGEELIITGGPVMDATTTWWRVQTLTNTGWIPERINDQPTMGVVDGSAG